MAASAEPSPGSSAPCPFCGGRNSGTTPTCRHCGQSLLVDCPGCEEYTDVEERECPHCGTVLGDVHDEVNYRAGLATAYLSNGKPRLALEAWQRVFDLDFSYPNIQAQNFQPFAPGGVDAVVTAAGFIFISFGGLLKIASIAEEVKNPGRTLPLGMIFSLDYLIEVSTALP